MISPKIRILNLADQMLGKNLDFGFMSCFFHLGAFMEFFNGICPDSAQDRVNFCSIQEGSGEGNLFHGEMLPTDQAGMMDETVE